MLALVLTLLACKDGAHPDPARDSALHSPPPEADDSAPTRLEFTCYTDNDGDGYGTGAGILVVNQCPNRYVTRDGDCLDRDPAVHPGAVELCNRLDDDCDGLEDDASSADASPWFSDQDADGFGAGEVILACAQPPGTSDLSGDCDDQSDAVHPLALELCNGLDDDCDGSIDVNAVNASTWYPDRDGDGYGDATAPLDWCEEPPGYGRDRADCDDSRADIHPGAAERDCDDPIDYNCDGGVGRIDTDGDGWVACEDCDDASVDFHPGADERCNGLDDDCDGVIDPDTAINPLTWYFDGDGDGYGVPSPTALACTMPSGYSDFYHDCDDTDPTISPGAPEVCDDDIDNDCDGTRSGCGVWGAMYLEFADFILLGEAPGDMLAHAGLSDAGDVNGDGFDDLLVGAMNSDRAAEGAGAIYLVSGGPDAASGLGTVLGVMEGEAAWDQAGIATASLGDTNNDGYDDMLVGAYFESTAAAGAGAAYLVLGPLTGTLGLRSADAKLMGAREASWAGQSVAGPGDVNGDGLADLLVGAPRYIGSMGWWEGAVYLLFSPVTGARSLGTADVVFEAEPDTFLMGQGIADNLGDVDGDGLDDIGIGAPASDINYPDSGTVYIIVDPQPGTYSVTNSDATMFGESTNSVLGFSMAGAGDVNQDGFHDLLVSAFCESSVVDCNGAAYLVLGPMVGSGVIGQFYHAKFTGYEIHEHAGRSLDGNADVDGDGELDLLIGAYYNSTQGFFPGKTYLARGPFSAGVFDLLQADATAYGVQDDDYNGFAVSFAGDVNSDGFDDVWSGAFANDDGGLNAGAAYLLLGGDM